MGSPSPAPRVITVAGTNGKGSTVAWLEQFASAMGIRHGSFTSPHLDHFSERIRLQGQAVDEALLVRAFEAIDAAHGETPLTYFECATLAALWIMARSDLQLAILEVGLGGRLDAVNLIDADVAIVTSIALDHTEWLGDNRESIGREKAGVFRSDQTAIYAGENPPQSIIDVARNLGTTLLLAERDYQFSADGDNQWAWSHENIRIAPLPSPGQATAIQTRNAAAALMGLHAAGWSDGFDAEQLGAVIASVRHPGRFEQIENNPAVIVDVSHNPAAAEVLANSIAQWKAEASVQSSTLPQVHLILATLADKDAGGMIDALSVVVDFWYLSEHPRQATGARWQSAEWLVELVRNRLGRPHLTAVHTLDAALQLARGHAKPGDLVVCCGSFLTASLCRAALKSSD